MTKEEQQAFEECKKAIKELLLEEKKTKEKLEKIQEDKLTCIRILLDDAYREDMIKRWNK